MWENLIIHAMLGVLQIVLKNPQQQTQLKTVLLQIRDTINEIYPDETK